MTEKDIRVLLSKLDYKITQEKKQGSVVSIRVRKKNNEMVLYIKPNGCVDVQIVGKSGKPMNVESIEMLESYIDASDYTSNVFIPDTKAIMSYMEGALNCGAFVYNGSKLSSRKDAVSTFTAVRSTTKRVEISSMGDSWYSFKLIDTDGVALYRFKVVDSVVELQVDSESFPIVCNLLYGNRSDVDIVISGDRDFTYTASSADNTVDFTLYDIDGEMFYRVNIYNGDTLGESFSERDVNTEMLTLFKLAGESMQNQIDGVLGNWDSSDVDEEDYMAELNESENSSDVEEASVGETEDISDEFVEGEEEESMTPIEESIPTEVCNEVKETQVIAEKIIEDVQVGLLKRDGVTRCVRFVTNTAVYDISVEVLRGYGYPVDRISSTYTEYIHNGMYVSDEERRLRVFSTDVSDDENTINWLRQSILR